jgi:hypothetical protein
MGVTLDGKGGLTSVVVPCLRSATRVQLCSVIGQIQLASARSVVWSGE